jgi:copper chaperone
MATVVAGDDTMERTTIHIGGMSCGHCVARVTKALRDVNGVDVEEVRVGTATVVFDPSTTSETRIAQAIEDQGYAVK